MRTTMEIFKHYFFTIPVILSFVPLAISQDDQSGFISLDCGLSETIGAYTEPTTGINYSSDDAYIDSGVKVSIPLESQFDNQKQIAHLRVFPTGIRNCYTINVTTGTSYLIRATFYYGNYDGKNNPPQFDLHLGANFWDAISFSSDGRRRREIIHVPLQDYVRICVVNTGAGTPFLSALELRPLSNQTYVTQSGSLALFTREDLGSRIEIAYRYPDDALDRGWFFFNKPDWRTINTTSTFNPDTAYKTPPVVLSTAITPTNPNDPLIFTWNPSGEETGFMLYLHFSEIEKLKANESRVFDIFVNGELYVESIVPIYLNGTVIYNKLPFRTANHLAENYNISLVKHGNSTLPPILNGIEIFSFLDLSQPETYQDDVKAITMIKSGYKVKKNWDGDPCAPKKYLWMGLSCSYEALDPPRITALNLSSSGLTGEISSFIFNLSRLVSLDLSRNGLTGPVPEFLSRLEKLKVLNLGGNNFTGSIPAELLAKSKSGSLTLRFDDSSTANDTSITCSSSLCETKKSNNILIPIISSIGGLLLVLLIVAAILIGLKRKKKSEAGIRDDVFKAKKRHFKFSEVIKITNDFKRVLGRGGFGTVYHGLVGDTQVAVKIISHSTSFAYQQFQAEVKLLMTVYHRNLTSLVGYCIEGTNMALIYEYMTNGDLETHLLGDGNSHVLSWEERLQIALDSAQGLEYLHNGCKPLIVHRDIKPANILLNDNLQAKLADFGLSKSFPTEGGTHVSTVVAGTRGYLDPEYYVTNRLTEKSDVYSFGVVLLQIIASQSAVISQGDERTHIGQWVTFMVSNGDIKGVVDQRLHDDFDTNSAWNFVEIALACISQKSSKRPSMSQVVIELKGCLESEVARKNPTRLNDSKSSTEEYSLYTTSEFSGRSK